MVCQRFGNECIGLYRDDGLSAIDLTGRRLDRARKDLIKIFQDCDLRVTVETLYNQTDFLDVNLDLQSGKFWPYKKPNNDLLYINAKSNHPPNIIKQLPKAIIHRIQTLSCNEEEFNKAMPAYSTALTSSGHHGATQFTAPTAQTPSRRRRRKVMVQPAVQP